MKFQSFRISGFKSFLEPTEIQINNGSGSAVNLNVQVTDTSATATFRIFNEGLGDGDLTGEVDDLYIKMDIGERDGNMIPSPTLQLQIVH